MFQIRNVFRYLPNTDVVMIRGDVNEQLLILQLNNKVKIEFIGWDVASGTPVFKSDKQNVIEISDVKKLTNNLRGRNNWTFIITAKAPGRAAISIKDPTNKNFISDISVCVGNFINHRDDDGNLLDVDLIANVFRGSDVLRKQILLNMLANDPGNYINENNTHNENKWGPLACGTVSKVSGLDLMNSKTEYDYQPYYKTIKPQIQTVGGRKKQVWAINDRAEIIYDENKLKQGVKAIQKRLKNGLPVVTGVSYIPSSALQPGGKLKETGTGGHTVLIVGCNADATRFLYIDPYGPRSGKAPRGSVLKYNGWLAGGISPFKNACEHLGMFELFDSGKSGRASILLRQVASTQASGGTFDGEQYLEVVSGPLN